jgi:hypothetical protein
LGPEAFVVVEEILEDVVRGRDHHTRGVGHDVQVRRGSFQRHDQPVGVRQNGPHEEQGHAKKDRSERKPTVSHLISLSWSPIALDRPD